MPMGYPLPFHSRHLIELQLELECVAVAAGDTLVPIPCPNPDGPVRFSVVRHDDTWSTFFRHDLPDQTRAQLAALAPEQAFHEHERVKAILDRDAPCAELWAGVLYVFPDTLTVALYPDAVRLDDTAAYAIVADGRVVATCSSSRENAACAEAWVTTEPAYRRRGYARQVVAAWAHDLQRRGKLPFYSHLRHNIASRAVARSLGLVQFLAAVGYL